MCVSKTVVYDAKLGLNRLVISASTFAVIREHSNSNQGPCSMALDREGRLVYLARFMPYPRAPPIAIFSHPSPLWHTLTHTHTHSTTDSIHGRHSHTLCLLLGGTGKAATLSDKLILMLPFCFNPPAFNLVAPLNVRVL